MQAFQRTFWQAQKSKTVLHGQNCRSFSPWAYFLVSLLGGATGLTAELFDTTFRDVEDLERTLGASAIAHVPRFKLDELTIPSPNETKLAPSLLAAHCPRSSEAEVYRVARTSLMIKFSEINGKVVMMSSPHPGDGKSTTLANLAVSLAHTGKQVLLIDSDLRRPVVAGLFGIENSPGLSDVLLGTTPLLPNACKNQISKIFRFSHMEQTRQSRPSYCNRIE